MPILDWLNKKDALKTAGKVPYRLLKPNKDLSYGDQSLGNMLIKGDNLDTLKALLPYYKGQVKCIYIDPPYNTGNAFEHYDDNIEHSTWLSLMYPRLEFLRELIAENGIIFIQIDDQELAYMKVIADEVFGRNNFINQVSVKMKQTSGASGGGEDKKLKKNIEYILIYSKNIAEFSSFNEIVEEENLFDLISDMRENGKSWKYTRVICSFGTKEFFKEIHDGSSQPIKIYKHSNVVIKTISELMEEENLTEEECYIKYFERIFRDTNAQSSIRTRVLEANNGNDFLSIEYIPQSGRNKAKLTTLYYKGLKCDLIAWLADVSEKKGNKIIKFEKLGTYWEGFPLNNLTKEGGIQFKNGKKPEALIERILELATNPGDLVLDSFLGSGTTAAVAQKMGRRYIGIEMGQHAITHCVPRLKKVIDGTDKGGISEAQNWQGGGGYTFYELGPAIFDAQGNINRDIDFKTLAFHVWFTETKTPMQKYSHSPLLGVCDDTAYYLLYNGILGDRSISGGNVLTAKLLSKLPKHNGKKVIYGEACRLSLERLNAENIIFKQTPYDIKAR